MWVRFDDAFPTHRKVDGLSDAAFRLHVSAIFWCARNLTDGLLPEDDLDLVSARVRTPARFAAELVRRELWIKRDDGWEINDYLEYQWSKERVLDERAKSAKRQRDYKERHANGVSHGVSNAVSNGAPSRPVPKGRTWTGNDQGDLTVTRARSMPPPNRCEAHTDDPSPPPCGACKDARAAAEQWEVDRLARIANAPKCRIHRGQLAHNCSGCISDAKVEAVQAARREGAT